MDKVNQEVSPAENQPSVKTASNLTFFKTLAYGFVIVSVGISIAVGGYLLGANKTKTQPIAQVSVTPTPLPTEASAKAGDPTADWKTYENSVFGFKLKYPQNFTINDTLPVVKRETVANQNLGISNDSVPENPKLTIWADPLGFGLTPPDIAYELAPSENNGVKIAVRTEVPQSQDNRNIDDETVIVGKTVRLGVNTYAFQFIFKNSGKGYEPILNQILSTFRFSN